MHCFFFFLTAKRQEPQGKMTMSGLILLMIAASLQVTEAYKVLVVFAFPGTSHSILGNGIVRNLLEAGHEVSYITAIPMKESNPNLHQIDVSANMELMPSSGWTIKDKIDDKVNLNDPSKFTKMMNDLNYKTLENENVQKFVNDPKNQIDVVIIEWMYSEFFSGLSAVFNCPHIWLSTIEPHWTILNLIDEPTSPAYVPNAISSNLPPFTFMQRVQELFFQGIVYFFKEIYNIKAEKEMFEKLYKPITERRGNILPDYEELKYNASIVLGNSHPSLGLAISLPQSYKVVGGYHIDTNVKPLPEDLKKILDNAKHGVIYFSMGSNLKSKDFPMELRKNLLQMFAGLKQTVLWKFEDPMSNLPQNVHILQWAPQPSILSHPNCILFITHGGLLSTTESIHFGKPIIGIPVFADQFNNIERATSKGFAKKVDLSYTMTNDLKKAIQDVLANPKYAEKAKELSFIYHHRPILPGKELVHWVEHVVETRGAPHLRSPALMVPWYQKMYLDLIILILIVLLLVKIVFKKIFCSRKTLNKNKKNN